MSGAPPKQQRLDAAFLRGASVRRVFSALAGSGAQTRIVGGAVRNALLGEEVHEIDFVTTLPPQETAARAAAAQIRSVPTGIEHGTVTLVIDGAPFEVTSAREDVETDGRRAKVKFGADFAKDAMRRDFTINALSVDADGVLYDPVGGLADIAARRVRFIGDARLRIAEDYLRILRFFRFHSAFASGPMDADAIHAIIAERGGLKGLSSERIRAELIKLIMTRNAAEVCAQMCDAGLLAPLMAGIAYPARLARVIAIEAAREAAPQAMLRWMALTIATPEDARRLHIRLRMSNAETLRSEKAAAALAGLHARTKPPAYGALREILFECGRMAATDAITLAQASSGAAPNDAEWRSAWLFLRDTPKPQLPFSGADLLARGLTGGREMGRILKTLQASWIRAGFPKDPASIARLLDEAAQRSE